MSGVFKKTTTFTVPFINLKKLPKVPVMQGKIAILYICTGNYYVFWPKFYESTKKYFLPGRYKNQREQIIITDKLLTMGLLFLGDAGQGKTNTMLSLTGQILENLEENDLAVIFDLKSFFHFWIMNTSSICESKNYASIYIKEGNLSNSHFLLMLQEK